MYVSVIERLSFTVGEIFFSNWVKTVLLLVVRKMNFYISLLNHSETQSFPLELTEIFLQSAFVFNFFQFTLSWQSNDVLFQPVSTCVKNKTKGIPLFHLRSSLFKKRKPVDGNTYTASPKIVWLNYRFPHNSQTLRGTSSKWPPWKLPQRGLHN